MVIIRIFFHLLVHGLTAVLAFRLLFGTTVPRFASAGFMSTSMAATSEYGYQIRYSYTLVRMLMIALIDWLIVGRTNPQAAPSLYAASAMTMIERVVVVLLYFAALFPLTSLFRAVRLI